MNDRWDVKCREVYMDNSQKYQIWLNGVVVGEIVNRFDAVEKLRNVFDTIEALQQENEQYKKLLYMAQSAMNGAIKAMSLGVENDKHYWWQELQRISNMINELLKEGSV